MIYCFGDTHGGFDIDKIFTQTYTNSDYIVICGDFGLLWSDIKDEREKVLESMYNDLPCTVLFVDGNHENFTRIDKLPEISMFGDFVGAYSDKIFHLKRGRIYTIEDMNFFVMGGALSIDKDMRIPGLSWWSGENITNEQVNFAIEKLKNFKGDIDFVLSHTIPASAVAELGKFKQTGHKIHDENAFQLEKIFLKLKERKFHIKAWIFGHWHYDIEFKVPFNKTFIQFYGIYNSTTILIAPKKRIAKKRIEVPLRTN